MRLSEGRSHSASQLEELRDETFRNHPTLIFIFENF